MESISRRGLVISAAAASAAFGLKGPLEFVSNASAQTASLMDKGFAKFKVGDVEVTTIFDGVASRPIDTSFIPGRSEADIKAALVKGGLPDDKIPNFFTVTVVSHKGKTIMFDSSTGGQLAPTAGLFKSKNLAAAGIDPAKISTIIVTHFHPDHIFGLMEKDTNAQVYPNAEIIVPAAEYKIWTDTSLAEKAPDAMKPLVKRIQATFPGWKNIKQIEAGKEVLPGVTAVETYGHTLGHTSYLVASGSSQLLVLGDVTNIPAINIANPDWSISFDSDKAMAAATRRKIFDRAIADKAIMTGYHWGMPGAGTVTKDGNGYTFVPVSVT